MRVCPNLSDPLIKKQWEALENEPGLGRVEAMREFLEAERANRPIGTPEQVKAKLKAQEIINPQREAIRRAKGTEELFIKGNDPVYTDPDTLMGLAVMVNPASKDFSIKTTSNTRGMEILNKMSKALGVSYQFVTPEEAVKITANADNPYNITKGPAFFYKGVVYFIGNAITTELAFHEFSHPLVRNIKNVNPILFDKLVAKALSENPALLEEAIAEYADLKREMDAAIDPEEKQALKDKYESIVAEEILVKAMTKIAVSKDMNTKTGLGKVVADILYAIKQALRNIFGRKIDISKLDVNTTLDQLGEMLVKGEQFRIDTVNVKESDVVAYFDKNAKFVKELNDVVAKEGNAKILNLTKGLYDGVSAHIRMLLSNKNLSALADLFVDDYNRGDFQEIKANLKKYAVELESKAEAFLQEVGEVQNGSVALVSSMLRLEVVMDKMEKHLTELQADLVKDPGNEESVKQAYSYGHIVDYWIKYLDEAKALMSEGGKDNRQSEIVKLINNISETAKAASAKLIDISHHGVAQVLWEQWEEAAEQAEKLFVEQAQKFKKAGASQKVIDRRYVEFYGVNEADKAILDDLRAKESLTTAEKNTLQELENATLNGLQITKSRIERALKGEGKDAHWANSYLEGYLYNTDPVVGGFAMYYKNNMAEMEARVQARFTDIQGKLDEVLKGKKFPKIGELGTKIGFVDTIGYFDTKLNSLTEKKVWTLLNPYTGYRYDVDKFNDNIKNLQNNYLKDATKENKVLLEQAIAEKAAHMRKHFQQEFVDEYYAKDDLLEQDEIGMRAAYERKKIIEEINDIMHPLITEYDVLKVSDQIDALWKKYRLLYSLYYPNGKKKTNSFVDANGETVVTNDLAIAERLQEHREHTRDFYEFKKREGVFQSALKNFEAETRALLDNDTGLSDSEKEERFQAYRSEWLKRNTRIAIKPAFYEQRAKLIEQLQAILSKLPSSKVNQLDFSKGWKTILDVVSGYRDDDGQPNGGQMSDGRKDLVKEAQQQIEDAKAEWAGFSGLTTEEMDDLVYLSQLRKDQSNWLDPQDYKDWKDLLAKMKDVGLSDYDKADLASIFADLEELQKKEPTPYYLEAMNHWMEKIGDEEFFKKTGMNDITGLNLYKLNDPKILKMFFQKSPEFQEWYEQNHIFKMKYNTETQTKEAAYERLYIWNVIKPNDPSFYESTVITNENGEDETIPGLPTLKYYARVVKKEFRTGYNPATGNVELKVGVHKDNKGDWLPKNTPDSIYRNEEYFKLKNAPEGSEDNQYFKILEVITEAHIENQEGLSKRAKLYLDFPRFKKSNLEVVQSGGLQKKAKNTGTAFSEIWQRFKDFLQGSKADAGDELNYKKELQLIRADAFGEEISNIPIQGVFDLTEEETSTDIITSMYKYLWGAENHKQLVKMNPMATGIQKILNDPNNKLTEEYQIDRSSFINAQVTKHIKKKGDYIRRNAFNNFYEREFMGQTQTGPFADLPWLQNIQSFLFKRASFSFFALNIPSALKNAGSAKFQAMIHSSAGVDLNPASLVKGQAWSFKYMSEVSFSDIYSTKKKTLMMQLGEIFDPIQGRFQDKFGESVTRTLGKDVASMSWLTNFRKWTEIEANMQTFGGMMYKKKIPMGDTEIDYMDAWELNADGKIVLKAGIDPKYGITYDAEGNMLVGSEYKKFRARVHNVMNKLNGAYARFDQPEAQRYIAFRFVSYLRRYFTTMAINRFSKNRWSIGYGELDQGYYVQAVKALATIGQVRNLEALDAKDKQALMKVTVEIGAVMLLSFLIGAMFDWDDEDEDRYAKLRAKSGHTGFLGLTGENRPGEDFDPTGFLSLHAMYLMMQIKDENEQFIPLPGYGTDNLLSLMDVKSIAFGPTKDTYSMIATDFYNTLQDNGKQFYKRRVGPYEWQEKGGSKLWAHIGKMFGLTGASIDPAQGITNFSKAQNRGR